MYCTRSIVNKIWSRSIGKRIKMQCVIVSFQCQIQRVSIESFFLSLILSAMDQCQVHDHRQRQFRGRDSLSFTWRLVETLLVFTPNRIKFQHPLPARQRNRFPIGWRNRNDSKYRAATVLGRCGRARRINACRIQDRFWFDAR